MVKLLVLADDFTGALDTGVQFAKKGISTFVTTNIKYDFNKTSTAAQVLVMNLESRHLKPETAYKRVYDATKRALKANIRNIYKKTDSGLRGNIGSELAAVLDVSEEGVLSFIPAFPKINRTTRKGIHYINGIPVSRSVFGKDPFEPVQKDNILEIIRDQTNIETNLVSEDAPVLCSPEHIGRKIHVFDAETEKDLEIIKEKLSASGHVNFLAGCAGFAEFLPDIHRLQPDILSDIAFDRGLMVFSGSVNPITLEQVDYAEKHGFPVVVLSPQMKLAGNIDDVPGLAEWIQNVQKIYEQQGKVIIAAADSREIMLETDRLALEQGIAGEELRLRIAQNVGLLTRLLLNQANCGNLAVLGGDTLRAVMDAMDCDGIIPVREIGSGVVLSKAVIKGKNINIISKSGGFGKIDAICEMDKYINQK